SRCRCSESAFSLPRPTSPARRERRSKTMAVTAIPAQASGNMPPFDEIDTILTTYDTTYAWNYGSVKEGLRDLYEKAKRDQWNGTTQLAWDTPVDPEHGILPEMTNPLIGYAPYDS